MAELTPGERLALLKQEHGSLKEVEKQRTSTTFLVYNNDGVIFYKSHERPEDMRKHKNKKLVEPGDSVVISAGVPFGSAGTTNLLRLAEIIADKDLT